MIKVFKIYKYFLLYYSIYKNNYIYILNNTYVGIILQNIL